MALGLEGDILEPKVGEQQGDRGQTGDSQAGAGSLYSQGVFCLVDDEVHLVELALGDGSVGHQQADP